MNRWIIGSVVGSALVLGMGLAPAAAQHGHGTDEHGDKEKKSIQPMCPVMDEEANLARSIATDDGPVFFCCKGCIPKYEANPAKYAPKLAEQGYTVKLKEMKQASQSKSHDAHGHDGHDHGGHGHGDH